MQPLHKGLQPHYFPVNIKRFINVLKNYGWYRYPFPKAVDKWHSKYNPEYKIKNDHSNIKLKLNCYKLDCSNIK